MGRSTSYRSLTLLIWLAACNPLVVEPQLPEPPPAPGAVPCPVACARLAELGCPEADPTPDGASCVDVCQNVEDSGVLRYPTGCVAAATTCAEAQRCE
jgi:hypothetical protein